MCTSALPVVHLRISLTESLRPHGIEPHIPLYFHLFLSLLPVPPKPPINEFLPFIQFPKSISEVIIEISFIHPSIFPLIHAIPRLLIHTIVPLIGISLILCHPPNPIPIPQPLLEIPLVTSSISPQILPIPLR